MRNNKIITFAAILLILLLALLYYKPYKMPEDSRLKFRLEELAESKRGNNKNVIIDFSKITDFKWDILYIVVPYTSLKDFKKTAGIKNLFRVQTAIEWDDSVCLLLFVRNGNIVKYINHTRGHGDFATYLEGKKVSSSEAVFGVQEKDKYLYIIKIKR